MTNPHHTPNTILFVNSFQLYVIVGIGTIHKEIKLKKKHTVACLK